VNITKLNPSIIWEVFPNFFFLLVVFLFHHVNMFFTVSSLLLYKFCLVCLCGHTPWSFFVSDTCLAIFKHVNPFVHALLWQNSVIILWWKRISTSLTISALQKSNHCMLLFFCATSGERQFSSEGQIIQHGGSMLTVACAFNSEANCKKK
jgi:hypothetical protein